MDDLIEYLTNMLEDFDFRKLIFPTIIILLYVAGFVYLLTIIKKEHKSITPEKNITSVSATKEEEYIYIDVKGSVKKPGVYKLDSDARVIDAVEAAGGISKDANTRFTNLSKTLKDGDVVILYSNEEIDNARKKEIVYIETPCICEEIKNDACYKENDEESVNDKININTSSIDELKTLNGIGEAKAKAIIDYRNKNGNFKSIDELKNISGISESLFEKIKNNISI